MKYEKLFIETSLPEPLTKDQIYEYLEASKNGNLLAREKLMLHNIRLVINQVNKRFHNTPYEKQELVSIGLIGLIKSIDSFDFTKNVEFSTYAVTCISNEILMFICQNKKHIHNDSFDKTLSIDQDGKQLKLEDILLDEQTDLVTSYEKKESILEIRNLVESLEKRDKLIVMLYFGFYNDTQYTQKEIAEILNITQSYVSRLIKSTLQKLEQQLVTPEIVNQKNPRKIRKK